MVTLQLKQLSVPPGQRIILTDVNWSKFEDILQELGEKRASRVAYYQNQLEIRMPLPEHEFNKEIIGDMGKILLEELEVDRECYGSTTFKRKDMAAGIEPDNCFYIQNYRLMIGKRRLDLTVDPPPDLAIEVDVTSKTQLSAYEALGVPELWQFSQGSLRINLLEAGEYIESSFSPTFPDFPLIEGVSQFVQMSLTQGSSAALRAFRKWVRERIDR
ncbi:Uma2 family endonuclease [Limnofasciculus baicalensis]|uniref:Uma2 family endonuclease n=1 Tax=Limnofasciculus baicalensis BBK-W-15 TaxID=2699891 RepID=A0AAE3GND6_9CYAN|nr:Uma2 family endonuclease [Limnofasciculus baicalensis]MCP2727077.1 Uma2 family endonuclease [Limnofasciculus baicalensis BBK-W-15]